MHLFVLYFSSIITYCNVYCILYQYLCQGIICIMFVRRSIYDLIMCIVQVSTVTNQVLFFHNFPPTSIHPTNVSIVSSVQTIFVCIKPLGMQVVLHLGAPPLIGRSLPTMGGLAPCSLGLRWLVIPEPTV